MITPLVFTKQGRVLYTSYLSFDSKLHFFLKYTSSSWNQVKAVFCTCLCTRCLVDEDGNTPAGQSWVSGERLILSGPTDILCYGTSCGQPGGWLERQNMMYLSQRVFFPHKNMGKLKSLSGPHQLGLLGNPFFGAATPGGSCHSASFLSLHVVCQQWRGWHLAPLP